MRKDIIQKILNEFNERELDFDVYIIADVQGKTRNMDKNICHANEDEFFSRQEFSEIASAIFDAFGFAKVFYSESELILYLAQKKISPEECVIYNFARDGIFEGKKSLIPSFCDLYGYRYTGSNAFVISLLRNKYIYGKYLKAHSIPVPESWIFDFEKGFIGSSPAIGTKVIIKHINESSSIGLSEENICVFSNIEQIRNVQQKMNSKRVLVQQFIDGYECEVFVICDLDRNYHALDPVKIVFSGQVPIMDSTTSNNYDYRFELLENTTSRMTCESICRAAERAALLLDIGVYARFDFRISSNGDFYLFDIAGTPYTTLHSSPAFLFTKIYEYQYKDIYKTIIELTCQQ